MRTTLIIGANSFNAVVNGESARLTPLIPPMTFERAEKNILIIPPQTPPPLLAHSANAPTSVPPIAEVIVSFDNFSVVALLNSFTASLYSSDASSTLSVLFSIASLSLRYASNILDCAKLYFASTLFPNPNALL